MDALERAVVKKFKSLLLKQVPLHRIILFGSLARGDADPESDMDVVVIVKGEDSKEMREYVSECAWEAGFEDGIVVVPVVFTLDEWEHGPERQSLLVQAVKAEEIPLRASRSPFKARKDMIELRRKGVVQYGRFHQR